MALDPPGYSLLCAVVYIPCFSVCPLKDFGTHRLITQLRVSVVTTCQLQQCLLQQPPRSPRDSRRQCKASPSAEGQG